MDEKLKQQYTVLYGPFVRGEYSIDERVKSRYGSGEVIWSYRGESGLIYVIGDKSGFPVEVPASSVVENKRG